MIEHPGRLPAQPAIGNIRDPEVTALQTVGQFLGVDAEQVAARRVQVVHVHPG